MAQWHHEQMLTQWNSCTTTQQCKSNTAQKQDVCTLYTDPDMHSPKHEV